MPQANLLGESFSTEINSDDSSLCHVKTSQRAKKALKTTSELLFYKQAN